MIRIQGISIVAERLQAARLASPASLPGVSVQGRQPATKFRAA